MQPERHIPLQGASNFRDFGGYRGGGGRTVRWRRLYRSDHLSELTAADYETLGVHGIRLVYDLRRDSEAAALPTRWPGAAAPELIRSPLFTDEVGLNTFQRVAADEIARHDPDASAEIMRHMYLRMVTEPAPLAAFRRIFERLAEPRAFPALFHCAGGKDRTGVTCAMILSSLGVSREDILEDFMLTQALYDASGARKNRIAQIVAAADLGFWSEAALIPIFNVQRRYMDAALDQIAADGGIEAFLTRKVGVDPSVLARLRSELLE
jgi:protein-tyrosine phosphatase